MVLSITSFIAENNSSTPQSFCPVCSSYPLVPKDSKVSHNPIHSFEKAVHLNWTTPTGPDLKF